MTPPRPVRARLLVVDDEQAQAQALSELLAGDGHEVIACTDPAAALATLAAGGVDLLLTDLQMPGMDGLALLERALHLDPDLVALLMTGHGTVETAVAAMKNGALDFVLKPFRLSALRPVLARALEIRQLRLNARALAASLAERSAQLEAANRELDAFAARVAHDLQGPVQNMVGFAQILKELPAAADPRELGHLLDRLVASGERAATMIRDLLQFARLGNDTLMMQPVALDCLLVKARAALPGAERPGLQWRVGPLPVVNGDPSLLLMVFVNLLSNALKYSAPREQPLIEIGAEPAPQGGHRVWVADNGVGFDNSRAGRLFAPFERLHGMAEFPGTGMGLANVKRIVERHGGSVMASGHPDQGARIFVTLPG